MTTVWINVSSTLRLTSRQILDNIHLYQSSLIWRTQRKSAELSVHSREISNTYKMISGLQPCRALKSWPEECTVSSNKSTSVQLLSCVWLFVTPWTAACQDSLFITNCQGLLKLTSIELVMTSNHLILWHPFSSRFNLSQHRGLFRWVSSSHQVAKVLEFQLQHQSFQWIFRTDFL